MPNYHLFHQNLRVFGGGSGARNMGFMDAMGEISDELGTDRVLVAGYTEVMNGGKTADALAQMAAELDLALQAPLLFACGITALQRSLEPEYVAISVHKKFKIKGKGRVLKGSDKKWYCWSSDDLNIATLPNNLAADVRGLAYVYGTFNGASIVVGFMHNMYNLGDKSSIFQAIPAMMELIRTEHAIDKKVPIIFGGDFNLPPRTISRRKEVYTVYAEDEDEEPINTTKKHAYDYWISSVEIENEYASVFDQSRDVGSGLSDHGGIGLQLPFVK